MHRQIVYIGQIPQDTDQLLQNRNTMIGLGFALAAILGTSTQVDGLACTPNSPAALNVLVAPGSIYSFQNIDATAYGSVAADTTDQIVKQGINPSTLTLSCPAPGTTGQSVVYLIQAAYQDIDGGSTVLPYYNASNPASAWSGPNNTGVSQNTVRQGVCTVNAKTGVAATTGTQTTPAPDAGFIGLYAVTVANGQTTITSGNIVQLATAPFITPKLPSVLSTMQAGAANYAADTSGTANTITIALSPLPSGLTDGMPIRVKVANSITGATVMSVNGGGNVAVVNPDGSALSGGPVANGIYEFVYDANGTRWQLQGNIGTSSAFTTGDVKFALKTTADTGWIMCDDGTIGDASSGASTRANADTSALFTLLWNNVTDTYAPVTGGRGANAATDFAAHKKIALTKMLGRSLAISGSGSGLTARTLGQNLGEETHTPTLAEMFAHTHTATVTDPGHTHNYHYIVAGLSGSSVQAPISSGGSAYATDSGSTGITVANASEGSTTPFNVMQPTSFLNAMIKL